MAQAAAHGHRYVIMYANVRRTVYHTPLRSAMQYTAIADDASRESRTTSLLRLMSLYYSRSQYRTECH